MRVAAVHGSAVHRTLSQKETAERHFSVPRVGEAPPLIGSPEAVVKPTSAQLLARGPGYPRT